MKLFPELESPALVLDEERMDRNLRTMQAACDSAGVELWPHIKTHKMIAVLRRQLDLGARGATCAKLGEAESMLPSGVRRIFLAHSIADRAKAPRLRRLADHLDELILAVTSPAHCEALERLLESVSLSLPVLMAVDTGLGREGARDPRHSAELAARIRRSPRMKLIGLYTHEGHCYNALSPGEVDMSVSDIHRMLTEHTEAAGGDLPLWPGCSVTASRIAAFPGIRAVRPGSYVFGDLSLSEGTKTTSFEDNALCVLATVIDCPEPGLALIDAGSKTFSGDKTLSGLSARCLENPEIVVRRVNEEHGYLAGNGVDQLNLGDRLRFVPAHICPVVNLASEIALTRHDQVSARLPVDARGRSD
jgi:D-serine deaminase-like pyridoxal phosphate-dependent protein